MLLSFSLLLSCRSTKTTLSQTEATAVTSVAKVVETAIHSEVSEKQISSTGNSITKDSTEITIVETRFSLPDSTGRQFTTSTTTTTINKKTRKTELTASKIQEKKEINHTASSHRTDSTAISSSKKTDFEETKTPADWGKWLRAIPYLIVAFFAILLFRRLGLIK